MDIKQIEINGEVFPVEDSEARNSITAMNTTIAEQAQTIAQLQEQINAKKAILNFSHDFLENDTDSQTWDLTENVNIFSNNIMFWKQTVIGPPGNKGGIVTTSLSPGLNVSAIVGDDFRSNGITIQSNGKKNAIIKWTKPSGFVGNGVSLKLWLPEN